MKIMHYLNFTIYLLSLLFSFFEYVNNKNSIGISIITLYILLGITQPILAFVVLFIIDWSNKNQIKFVKRYWTFVILFFIIAYSISIFEFEFLMNAISIIPFCISIYFIYVTYKYQKNENNCNCGR
ncbi:hypothetical protein SAMN05428642_101136 [Flaviramulus basaltis]|uniref:Uncharacterized protein n=1 Tax=Flaviramulus basaltis TaxID=369401 RepID=A0A1K2IAN6_9FLAO|nr:hypothetical protein SAMN05428642_101136 [Flaviramulus basaltis]